MAAPLIPTSEPGIFRRGDAYSFRYRDRQGKQRRGSARTLKAAVALRSERMTDVARGEHHVGGRDTFAGYAAQWVDSYPGRTSRGISRETRKDYRKRLEQDAVPFFGTMRLAEITAKDVRGLVVKIGERGVAQNTIRLALAPVKALFATALEDGLIRTNPAANVRVSVPRATPDAVQAKALTMTELGQLVEATKPEWQLFIRTLAQTGLRISEMIALEWSDIDFGASCVHVRRRVIDGRVGPPKSAHSRRSVPLGPTLPQELWARRKAADAPLDTDLVWPSRRGGFLNVRNLHRDVLDPAAVSAGVPWAGFHSLRHTCASLLIRQGVNMKQVQMWMGHASFAFTMQTYVHLLPTDLPGADVFAGQSGHKVVTQGSHMGLEVAPPAAAESA